MAYRWVLSTAAASAAFTLLVVATPQLSFAYRSPAMHVAMETAAGLISLLAAQLAYGRFRRTLELRDLMLTAALFVFAVANLAFSTVPAITGSEATAFATWAPVASRLVGALLMAASAFAPARRMHRPGADARRWLGSCAGILILIGVIVATAADALPTAIDPQISPESSARPLVVGNPVVLALQLVVMLLFGLAAIGFARHSAQTGDRFIHWVAIGTTLAAFARLNYFLFPSLYTEWFYAGDVLRLGFFLALLAGGVTEIRATQRALAESAVLEERRRVARDLHDGVAQDLAFIIQHGRRLAQREGAPKGVDMLVTAAENALDESRHAIAALARPTDESFATTLERAAAEAASREGAELEVRIPVDIEVPDATGEALLRVVREAVTNAARHGRARHVVVELATHEGLSLLIRDDGQGFDVVAGEQKAGRRGLAGMRERVNALGGDLRISSSPGQGSEVEVCL
ncbi:MAG: ATP-binding protein, partial [Chloroflexota bacterium]|nr:ATP-binding protein [Chloroflexota bacterium]